MSEVHHLALKRFDAAHIETTKKDWERQLEQLPDVMPSEFLKHIEWVNSHMDYADGGDDGLAYGVFYKDHKHAIAVVDVVYTRRGTKWLKMLGVNLSPELFVVLTSDNPSAKDMQKILEIYGAAITGTVKLTGIHPSNTVKLYGRTGTLLAFLKGIAAYLRANLDIPGITVNVEGNWLVFRNNKKAKA